MIIDELVPLQRGAIYPNRVAKLRLECRRVDLGISYAGWCF